MIHDSLAFGGELQTLIELTLARLDMHRQGKRQDDWRETADMAREAIEGLSHQVEVLSDEVGSRGVTRSVTEALARAIRRAELAEQEAEELRMQLENARTLSRLL